MIIREDWKKTTELLPDGRTEFRTVGKIEFDKEGFKAALLTFQRKFPPIPGFIRKHLKQPAIEEDMLDQASRSISFAFTDTEVAIYHPTKD